MENLLNVKIDYQVRETSLGTWRRFLYSNGSIYSEFRSDASVGSWPLIHIVRGRSPETGKIATARGVIAIGQKAVGVVAIGQVAMGVFTAGQLSLGLLLGIGQAATGVIAVGQFATGVVSIGQFGLGIFGIAQPKLGLFLRKF